MLYTTTWTALFVQGLLVDSDMKVALPLVVFGGLMIMSGLLAFTLPETLGKKLPETIEQAVLMRYIISIESLLGRKLLNYLNDT